LRYVPLWLRNANANVTDPSFIWLSALFVAPRFTAGKSADQRNLSPRNEKRQFQSLVAVAGNRKREIEIQSEGWESCGGEGGTCCVWDQSFKVDHKEN